MIRTAYEFLDAHFPRVPAMDYYRELFPIGSLERKGEYAAGKYCGIAITITDEGKAWRTHITDELEQLPALIDGEEFTMLAPISFAGKRATKENARWLHALVFDLDFIRRNKEGELVGMSDLFYQSSVIGEDPFNRLPRPTYVIASSERNLHVVYLLNHPIALYENVIKEVRHFRKEFIGKLWNSYITEANKSPQYETSPVQAFRLVGSKSKNKNDSVVCYRTGEPVSIDYLNEYVSDEAKIKFVREKGTYTKQEAKELFPDWYEKRVVEKIPTNSWQCHRGLYEWWKRRLPEIEVGHRYHYLLCMGAYAIKCGISRDELSKDVMNARRELDRISPAENPLTISDAMKAIQSAKEVSRYMTRDTISKLCGIEITKRKRNGRKQAQHMIYLNGINAARRSIGENLGAGRPSVENKVREYLEQHPQAKAKEVCEALGIGYSTARKWLKIIRGE